MRKTITLLLTKLHQIFIYLLGVVCLITLVGCAQFGIGETEYGCQGMPSGVKCLSASEVYALAESRNREVNKSSLIKPYDNSENRLARIWIAQWQDEEGNIFEGHFIHLSR
ncbi:hypothetical protein [Thorsellia kenyensis]|uniref:Uncharacterized protein n=1 Tax=Thorsellia kenyensis TaxID=1549888 RepID=A0ABV6CD81_9GAMM